MVADPTGASKAVPSRRLGRSTRRSARRFVKDIRRLLRRHDHRLNRPDVERLERALQEVETAVGAGVEQPARDALARADELADQVVGFARKSATREYVESVAVAVAIALMVRSFGVEAFKIPSGSMIPTLEVGDHIFVNKFLYGLRVPLSNAWFARWSSPQRGDVIVFRFPPDMSKDYIKRVVAVAGDRVATEGDRVFVNDEELPREMTSDRTDEDSTFREVNAGAEYFVRYDAGGSPFRDLPREGFSAPGLDCEEGPPPAAGCVVQDGFLFVMGDNRNNSEDSRMWGATPVENVKGKAMFVWASWRGSWFDFRFERVGRSIR